MTATRGKGLCIGVVALVLVGCAGDERSAAASQVRTCLQDGGVATSPAGSDAPLLSGVRAIGVLPGAGGILPGNLAAAVFLFNSGSEAEREAESLNRFGGGQVLRRGNAAVWYNPIPSADLRAKVEACLYG